MINFRKIYRRIKSDQEGAALMEFGLIAGPFILILLGIMDIGYQGYVSTLAKSKLHEVARLASTGAYTSDEIKDLLEEGLDPIVSDDATVTVSIESYFDFTNVGAPEKLSKDDGNGVLDSGDCYLDGNNNGIFDTDYGVAGVGGPDDIVKYTINIEAPRMFPLAGVLGISDTISSSNSTAVRNQPYGARVLDVEICEP